MSIDRPRLLVLDIIGTTIQDGGIVPAALRAVMREAGVEVSEEDVRRIRGASKRDAIAALMPGAPDRAARAAAAHAAFNARLTAAGASGDVRVVDGAEATLSALRASGMRIALTTGLERDVAEALVAGTSLHGILDALICGGDVGAGRPAPFLIFRAMEATGVTSVHDVACVGDTPLDLQAGFNAGVRWNIGVLTGGQSRQHLMACPHTGILDSVAELGDWSCWRAGGD